MKKKKNQKRILINNVERTVKVYHRKINWGVITIDLAVMFMAIFVSVWQDNPQYLWLLVLLMGTGESTY